MEALSMTDAAPKETLREKKARKEAEKAKKAKKKAIKEA
jgi:hypothetical protein